MDYPAPCELDLPVPVRYLCNEEMETLSIRTATSRLLPHGQGLAGRLSLHTPRRCICPRREAGVSFAGR